MNDRTPFTYTVGRRVVGGLLTVLLAIGCGAGVPWAARLIRAEWNMQHAMHHAVEHFWH